MRLTATQLDALIILFDEPETQWQRYTHAAAVELRELRAFVKVVLDFETFSEGFECANCDAVRWRWCTRHFGERVELLNARRNAIATERARAKEGT